jgi:hypothetical protein
MQSWSSQFAYSGPDNEQVSVHTQHRYILKCEDQSNKTLGVSALTQFDYMHKTASLADF